MFESLKRWLDALEFDFVSWRYVAGGASIVAVALSWLAFFAVGPNWGIDFTGGTEIHLKFNQDTAIGEVRQALRAMDLSDDAVQGVNGDDSNEFIIRIQDAQFGMAEVESEVRNVLSSTYGADWIRELESSIEVSARFAVTHVPDRAVAPAEIQDLLSKSIDSVTAELGKDDNQIVIKVGSISKRIEDAIRDALGGRSFEVLSTDAVGPKVGGELRRQGFISIAATLGLVLLYVAFRFDIGFAPGAVVALFHDVSLTIGVFVLAQLEFNLPMIGALLTIVGYSLNDTIVIYDRIRENRDKHRRTDLDSLINVSISETLTRTVATSATTMMAILMFLAVGGPVIRNFAFAMFLGIIFGTYSTVFVASPMILLMEDVKPWLARMVAIQDDDDDSGPPIGSSDDDEAPKELTESEKRRRARADAEKREPV